MPLDSAGVTATLQPVCPLDGVAGPYAASAAGTYPDGNGAGWRLDFGTSSTASQQQAAVGLLAQTTSYAAPQTAGLTPYRLSGTVTFGATLAVGTTVLPAAVAGLLRNDTPTIAIGAALPQGVDVRAAYPDPSKDGAVLIQVAVLQALTGATTVPFALIGVR